MTDVDLGRPSGFELAAEAIKLACVLSMVGCGQGEHSGEGSIRCTKKRKAAALCIASSRVGEVVRYSNAEYGVNITQRPQRHKKGMTEAKKCVLEPANHSPVISFSSRRKTSVL
jgi:hypothetical protein